MSGCPDDAHVHGPHVLVMHRCWLVVLDGRLVVLVQQSDEPLSGGLVGRGGGIVPVPDRVPDELVWGPAGRRRSHRLPAAAGPDPELEPVSASEADLPGDFTPLHECVCGAPATTTVEVPWQDRARRYRYCRDCAEGVAWAIEGAEVLP